jgi:cell division protein ZipA
MQTDLQLLLLIIGLVFGGFILYNTFRHKSKKSSSSYEEFESKPPKATSGERHDPLLDSFAQNESVGKVAHAANPVQLASQLEWDEPKSDVLFEAQSLQVAEPIFEAPKPAPKKVVKAKKTSEVIALSIIPKNGTFTGAMLSSALKSNQFHYGEHKIFHRHKDENPKAPILFSVASLVEPGNFEIHQMFNKSYPGILLWMMLPVSQDAMQCFDKMLKSARQLASFLNAELCDTKRLTLSTEAIATMRERVHQFQVKQEQEQELEFELEDAR